MTTHESDRVFDPLAALQHLGADRLLDLDLGAQTVVFSAQAVDDADFELVLRDLPPLEVALQQRETDPSLLIAREMLWRQDALDGGVLSYMYDWLQSEGEPFVVLTSSTPLRNPEAKQAFLQSQAAEVTARLGVPDDEAHAPQPLRTVTLSFPPTPENPAGIPVLVSAATLVPFIDKPTKVLIGNKHGVSAKKSKEAKINDPRFDAKNFLGLSPGTVCPFITPGLGLPIQGFYYLHRDLPPTTPVEIAVSPAESIFVKRGQFERMQRDFMGNLPSRRFKEFPLTS